MVWLIRHLKPFHNSQGLIPSTFYPNVPIENKTNAPMTGSAHPGIGGGLARALEKFGKDLV